MDRAAIGLGGVFIHLNAELNFYQLFNEALEDYALDRVADRQSPPCRRGAGVERRPFRCRHRRAPNCRRAH
jgi:hypothetical protein